MSENKCRYCAGELKPVTTLFLPIPNKYFASREEARAALRMPHALAACTACGSHSLTNTPFTPDELFAGNYAFLPVGKS